MIVNNKGSILAFSSSSKTIKRIAMQVISLLQDYKKGDIVVALSVLWLMLCERFEVEPNDMLAKAERIRNSTYTDKFNHQFMAIKEYFDNEI